MNEKNSCPTKCFSKAVCYPACKWLLGLLNFEIPPRNKIKSFRGLAKILFFSCVAMLSLFLHGSWLHAQAKTVQDLQSNKELSKARGTDAGGFLIFENVDFFQGELGEAYVSFKTFPEDNQRLIAGWREFEFSSSFADVLATLKTEYPWIQTKNYNDFDIPQADVFYLQSFSNTYFNSIEFLFDKENSLQIIRLSFAPRWFSFLELLNSLEERYGKPDIVSFPFLAWLDENANTIELTRAGIIRYIRKDTLDVFTGKTSDVASLPLSSSSFIDQQSFKENLLDGL